MSGTVTARITPAFSPARAGWVHSCFERTVNLAFPLPGEPPLLLTLLRQGLPAVPDSVSVPPYVIEHIRGHEKEPAEWTGTELKLCGLCLTCERIPEQRFSFRLTRPAAETFLRLYAETPMDSGLDGLPERIAEKAFGQLTALCEALVRSTVLPDMLPLGLGKGTTPSADDMAVGILSALGGIWREKCEKSQEMRIFSPEMLASTTDISVKYLRSAQEGYFSEAVRGVWNNTDSSSLSALRAFGATSGADMLRGMALACRVFLREGGNSHEC